MSGQIPVNSKRGRKPGSKTTLTPRQVAFLKGIEQGKSKRQAAVDAGYAQSVADTANRKIIPSLRVQFERAVKRRFDMDQLALRIKEGLDATRTEHYTFRGQVVDERTLIDWMTRYKYCDLATTLIGAQISRQQHEGPDGGPMQLQVAVMHIGRPDAQVEHRQVEQPQDVVVGGGKQKVIDVSD